MTPADLTAWRTRMGWLKGEAADALGLSPNGYGAYERGYVVKRRIAQPHERGITADGTVAKPYERGWLEEEKPRPIPKHIELACERLEDTLKSEAAKLSPSL